MLRHHVHTLSTGIGERSVVWGDGLDRAKDYVSQAFREAGLTVREQTYDYEGQRVANLIADLPDPGPGTATAAYRRAL